MKGKLIVFEGTDGSGKATQANMMAQRLREEGYPLREIDFPRYGNPFAEPARLYLAGALGDHPGDVNAYAASTLFAVDRYASYKEDWGKDYEAGRVILANRYTTSNAVHQASKLATEEQAEYVRWLFDLEYDRLGLEEEYTELLGNKVVCHSLPIRPGRNLAVICEAAAVNHRQKKMGYNAAQELYRRVQANLNKKDDEEEE